MIRQTGGLAWGATSTRSRSRSWARCIASWIETMPICWPSAPTSRTCGARILSFTRGSTDTPHHLRKGLRRPALKDGKRSAFTREYRRGPRTRREQRNGPPEEPVPRCATQLRWLDVRSLLALRSLYDFEFDGLAFGQRAVALADDRREVDEHVVPVGTSDEAVALLVAEPLHRSLRQPDLLALLGGRAPPPAARSVACSPSRSNGFWRPGEGS